MVAMSLFRINKAELSGAQYMARYWRLYAAGVAYEVIGAIVVQRLNIKIQKGVNQLYELLFKNS